MIVDTGIEDKELESCLPLRFRERLADAIRTKRIQPSEITELRLRLGRMSSVTVMGSNIPLSIKLCEGEMRECVTALCKGSVYAHADTIRQGYIRFGRGIRVGICGTLASDGRGVRDVSSLNIRIPHAIRGVCRRILPLCMGKNGLCSVLIYSSPGIGKTTLLRDIAAELGGRFMKRTAVIDSRGELYVDGMFDDTLCDVLIGYPKAVGIELATRTLSPEVIICDEIGDVDETRQILSAQNAGVPMIASAHASSMDQLLLRPNIRMLHDSRVFTYYVGASREYVNGKLGSNFRFDAVLAEDMQCICL